MKMFHSSEVSKCILLGNPSRNQEYLLFRKIEEGVKYVTLSRDHAYV